MFPAMHAMLGQWAPPLERSFLGSMVVAGQSIQCYKTLQLFNDAFKRSLVA